MSNQLASKLKSLRPNAGVANYLASRKLFVSPSKSSARSAVPVKEPTRPTSSEAAPTVSLGTIFSSLSVALILFSIYLPIV